MAKKKTKSTSKTKQPLSNGKNKGQFAEGNKAAKGHKSPQATMQKDFSRWFKEAVTKADILAAKNKLMVQVRKGNVKAIKEFLDRCMGKAPQSVNLGGHVDLTLTGLLELIDGSTKGKLPDEAEGQDAGE